MCVCVCQLLHAVPADYNLMRTKGLRPLPTAVDPCCRVILISIQVTESAGGDLMAQSVALPLRMRTAQRQSEIR